MGKILKRSSAPRSKHLTDRKKRNLDSRKKKIALAAHCPRRRPTLLHHTALSCRPHPASCRRPTEPNFFNKLPLLPAGNPNLTTDSVQGIHFFRLCDIHGDDDDSKIGSESEQHHSVTHSFNSVNLNIFDSDHDPAHSDTGTTSTSEYSSASSRTETTDYGIYARRMALSDSSELESDSEELNFDMGIPIPMALSPKLESKSNSDFRLETLSLGAARVDAQDVASAPVDTAGPDYAASNVNPQHRDANPKFPYEARVAETHDGGYTADSESKQRRPPKKQLSSAERARRASFWVSILRRPRAGRALD
ncbi:hypothetical protein CVT26_016132 [Gymnopilus dilepis]|uniref:Uncharacterized protein n=1 Tax=Gymnopilus dilepis TaxID=231916 RepID=A0A409XYV8_9AGAR|nr:hypothetical protein CVT26_016132 [Gymnopilus dilepis]